MPGRAECEIGRSRALRPSQLRTALVGECLARCRRLAKLIEPLCPAKALATCSRAPLYTSPAAQTTPSTCPSVLAQRSAAPRKHTGLSRRADTARMHHRAIAFIHALFVLCTSAGCSRIRSQAYAALCAAAASASAAQAAPLTHMHPGLCTSHTCVHIAVHPFPGAMAPMIPAATCSPDSRPAASAVHGASTSTSASGCTRLHISSARQHPGSPPPHCMNGLRAFAFTKAVIDRTNSAALGRRIGSRLRHGWMSSRAGHASQLPAAPSASQGYLRLL